MSTYCNLEAYKYNFFSAIPIPRTGEALILSGGIGADLLITPNINPAFIRRGKYTQLVRIKTGPQTVSGEIRCYCKSQTYQFRIRYNATCCVSSPLEAWANQCPDLNRLAEAYYLSLFTAEAAGYEMNDLAKFQKKLNTDILSMVKDENGLQIGPLQSVQVEMDAEYRAHLHSMQKDTEKVELETHRIKNADQLHQAPITSETALLRDVLDGKKTLDDVLQESKQRKIEDVDRLKTLLEKLNELRSSGVIGEEIYQQVTLQQLTQLAPTLQFQQLESPEQLAPDPEDL